MPRSVPLIRSRTALTRHGIGSGSDLASNQKARPLERRIVKAYSRKRRPIEDIVRDLAELILDGRELAIENLKASTEIMQSLVPPEYVFSGPPDDMGPAQGRG